ncbi:MAG: hypothetical protein ACTS73_09510, partial [Arsenophonus sp. NEOnobi-MAG3]
FLFEPLHQGIENYLRSNSWWYGFQPLTYLPLSCIQRSARCSSELSQADCRHIVAAIILSSVLYAE